MVRPSLLKRWMPHNLMQHKALSVELQTDPFRVADQEWLRNLQAAH